MKTFLLILVLFLSETFFAQNKILGIGIEAGPLISSMYGFEHQKEIAYGRKITATEGVFVLIRMSDHLSIKTGLLRERKGNIITGKYEMSGYWLTYKESHDFDYATIPLLLRASWGKKVKRFFTLGGYYSHLYQKSQISYGTYGEYPKRSFDNSGSVKNYDWGIIGGIGLSYAASENVLLSLELRDNLGLANISTVPVNGKVKTNAVSFLMGLSYQFLKDPYKKYDLKAPKSE